MITLDIPARRLEVDVSDEELARRRAEWQPVRRELSGWLKRLRGDGHIGRPGSCFGGLIWFSAKIAI